MVLKPTMTKPQVLLIESSVQEIDEDLRARLGEKFEWIKYDCPTISAFTERLQPGGPYSNIAAIVRTGWHKIGPYGTHRPFSSEIVPHFPPSLKIICCSGHGYDAADIKLLTERGIVYANTPDTCTEAVANTALSLVLETFRYFTFAQWCARNDWLRCREIGTKAVDPQGCALGIVGLGDIGLAIAQKCESGLGMNIHYHGPRRKSDSEKQLCHGAKYHETLDAMIRVVHCIVIAAPYTAQTHHLFSTPQFNLAKPGGMRIVNIARGKMIDEVALLEAIEEGKVVGVGLDVHYNEPEVNAKLRENWMVTVLPHIGVVSRTSWKNFERACFENLEAFFITGRPKTPVNEMKMA